MKSPKVTDNHLALISELRKEVPLYVVDDDGFVRNLKHDLLDDIETVLKQRKNLGL